MKISRALSVALAVALGGLVSRADGMALLSETSSNWSGLESGGVLHVPGAATCRYPDGPRGMYKHGFRVLNDSAAEWHNFYGARFELNLPDAREVELTVTIRRAGSGPRGEPVRSLVRVSGEGWHTITLPWSAFQFQQANTSFLKYVKEFTVAARLVNGKPGGKVRLRNASVVKAPVVAVECDTRGKPGSPGRSADYEARVSNCTRQRQSVALSSATRSIFRRHRK